MILQDLAKLRLTDQENNVLYSNEYIVQIVSLVSKKTPAGVLEAEKVIEVDPIQFYPNPIYTHPLFGVL